MSELDPCLVVIPARGGSKGLPGKNIRPLLGLPLIAHSIACAKMSKGVARAIVSTDSEEIAAVARANGADVPFLRPAELAQDDTPMMPVLQHALAFCEKEEKRTYGSLILLDPTSPGRFPSDIDAAREKLLLQPAADGILAVSQPTFNPFFTGVVEKDGTLELAMGAAMTGVRRQEFPRFLRINGSLYLWRTRFLRTAPARWIEGSHIGLEIPESRAFSVDDLYEFRLIEAVLEKGIVEFPWLTQDGKREGTST